MEVTNIHKRVIACPAKKIGELLLTLASKNDGMLATDKWPAMKLDKGLQVGSRGGHGPIKYVVEAYTPEQQITFRFEMEGFDGTHKFEILEVDTNTTELSHIISMSTSGLATIKWIIAIRWLHDAFIEDAFDKVENKFTTITKTKKWNAWVKLLRKIMQPKRKKPVGS